MGTIKGTVIQTSMLLHKQLPFSTRPNHKSGMLGSEAEGSDLETQPRIGLWWEAQNPKP